MFTHIQDIHFFSQQEQHFSWRGSDASGQLCTFTGTSLGPEIIRVVLRRGAETNERRYPVMSGAAGTLPYLSWMVDKGDESWPFTELRERVDIEAFLQNFAASETALVMSMQSGEKGGFVAVESPVPLPGGYSRASVTIRHS